MSNDRFSRVRAFAGPNSLEPSRNPSGPSELDGRRIITGNVSLLPDGSTIVSGAGFTVEHLVTTGQYTINFSTPFLSTLYSFVANVNPNLNNIFQYPLCAILSGSQVKVDLYELPTFINLNDGSFSFIAIGN